MIRALLEWLWWEPIVVGVVVGVVGAVYAYLTD